MVHGPSGFEKSPVTKFLILFTSVWSFLASSFRRTDKFNIDLPAIQDGQYWRLFTHHFVFLNMAELVIGCILMYNWRMFERQFGSKKFAGAVLFFFLWSTLTQCLLLLATSSAGLNSLSGGPYSLIFGLYACFLFDIPQSTPFKLFNIPMSDKVFIYLLGFQLVFANFPVSVYTSLVAFVGGLLYRCECLPFHRLRFPSFISSFCGQHIAPLLTGQAAAPRFSGEGHVLGGAGNRGYAQVEQGEMAEMYGETLDGPLLPAGNIEVDEVNVAQLTSMGFEEVQVRNALRRANNNIEAATNLLVG